MVQAREFPERSPSGLSEKDQENWRRLRKSKLNTPYTVLLMLTTLTAISKFYSNLTIMRANSVRTSRTVASMFTKLLSLDPAIEY